MKNPNAISLAKLDTFLDEAKRLHEKLQDAKKDIADFNSAAADELGMKVGQFKKLVSSFISPSDEKVDEELKALVERFDEWKEAQSNK